MVWHAASAYEAQNVGEVELTSEQTWAQAKPDCDSTPSCLGLSVGTTAGSYRTFATEGRGFFVSKVRVFGPDLNTWIPDPTA